MKQSRTLPDTVRLNDGEDAVQIIDQTKLPYALEFLLLRTPEELWDAIYALKVRGAPAIGVTAALGMFVVAKNIPTTVREEFDVEFARVKSYLDSARPTAVNLSWALERMHRVLKEHPDEDVPEIVERLGREAHAVFDEDIRVCRSIGEHGLNVLSRDMGLLTHCNAGRLAAVRYGTATAPIYVGEEKGYNFRVFCDETRPVLQGIRLTAYELMEGGIDTTVICDNMAPTVMRRKMVDAVLVGCDRVAANGDTANKIGTSGVALAAKYYGIPFYVCAPTSTIDLNTPNGDAIRIEERDGSEITELWYEKRMAPPNVGTFNPSFDVTDARNITGFITEYGIAYPPFEQSLVDAVAGVEMKEGKH